MTSNVALLLSAIDRHLLDDYQHNFPLDPQPFATIAEELGTDEAKVIERLEYLQRIGALSRVGPVLRPNRVGASTLAALAVPVERIEAVAAQVSAFPEVNHNYEREHEYNLWFVVTARDRAVVDRVLADIAAATGLTPLDLPMLEDYFIDLGFALKWS
ncbi:MAG: Lrp/AsnC family transcriptional regulator [Chromatiaceae bacterium]|nr:Lrp/AsnC family transcriptional regulator [Chromatiaceae bacterium]